VYHKAPTSENISDNAAGQKNTTSSEMESSTTLNTQLQPTIEISRYFRHQLEHSIDMVSNSIALQCNSDESSKEGMLLALAQASVGVLDSTTFRPFDYILRALQLRSLCW
jgi:hypothetical protein